MRRVCVRGIGNNRTHFVDVLERSLDTWEWEDEEFEGLATPLISLCKVRIKSSQSCVEVVSEAPNCQACIKKVNDPLDIA